MKINKKILGLIIVASISFAFTGCSSNSDNSDTQQNVETSSNNIDLSNLSTYEDVNLVYEQNLEKIMNKEQIQELDNITFDKVLEYAKKSSDFVSTIENDNDKISTIDKLVSIDDLSNNTSKDVMEECLKYIINEYEKNNLQDESKVFEYQYVTRYLDKKLDNHPNMKDADDMIFDMYQITKDTVRCISYSADANIEQVNDKISSVKNML